MIGKGSRSVSFVGRLSYLGSSFIRGSSVQAGVIYRDDRPRFPTNMVTSNAECYVRAPLFPPRINSETVSVDSFRVEPISPTLYNVIVDFSFDFVQGQTEVVTNFLLWLRDGPAPQNLLTFVESLDRLSPTARQGRIEETFDLELNQTKFMAYFQVRLKRFDNVGVGRLLSAKLLKELYHGSSTVGPLLTTTPDVWTLSLERPHCYVLGGLNRGVPLLILGY